MFESVRKLACKVGVKMKKNAPELWLGAGLLLFAADVVVAVRAGTKLKKTLKPHYEEIDRKKEWILMHDPEKEKEAIAHFKKEINKEQMATAKDLALLFGPVVLINAAGSFCMFKCYNTLKSWNTGLITAYNALLEAYAAYRTNNVRINGPEADRLALLDGQKATITDVESKEVLDAIKCPTVSKADLYGRIFDVETSKFFNPNWLKNPQYILDFVELVRRTAEEKRQENGFVQFSDVLSALGMGCDAYTYVHGWDKTPVSFGIENYPEEVIMDFKRGMYPALRLDFNCDGLIIWAMNKCKEA